MITHKLEEVTRALTFVANTKSGHAVARTNEAMIRWQMNEDQVYDSRLLQEIKPCTTHTCTVM